MKKILIGVALLLGSTPMMIQPDGAVDIKNFAQALCQISGRCGVGEASLEREREERESPEAIKQQVADRIQRLREKIAFKEIETPKQAVAAAVEYVALRATEIFAPLIDHIADLVKDESAKQALKKLLPAFADGVVLTSHLISKVATKKYLYHIKALRNPIDCLLTPKAQRAGKTNKKGDEKICGLYLTQRDAFKAIFKEARPFIMPIAQAMVTGVTVGDRKVKGLVVNAVDIIIPSLSKDTKLIAEVFELVLNMFDQFEKGIVKTESK